MDVDSPMGPDGPGVSKSIPPNEQGIILNRYLQKWDYVSIHIHLSFLSGNNIFTYESEAHGSFSIDHVLCPRFFVSSIQDALVLSDHHLNTSDHLPLLVCIPITVPQPGSKPPSVPHPSPNWKRCNDHLANQDAEAVTSSLPLVPPFWSSASIDSTVLEISNVLVQSASCIIPPIKFHKRVRPNWNAALGNAHLMVKNAYKKWCSGGKPSDPSNQLKAII